MNPKRIFVRIQNQLQAVPPGDVLREDCMKPLGLSASAVAPAIGCQPFPTEL